MLSEWKTVGIINKKGDSIECGSRGTSLLPCICKNCSIIVFYKLLPHTERESRDIKVYFAVEGRPWITFLAYASDNRRAVYRVMSELNISPKI